MEELEIKKIFEMMWRKKTIIIGIMVITLLLGVTYSFIIKKPLYLSNTKILLEKNETSANELLKSDDVLSQVKTNLNLEVSIPTLRQQIQSKYNEKSRVIEMSVTSQSASYSYEVVKEISTVYMKKIEEILGLKNSKLVQEAQQPISAYNVNHLKDILIALIIAVVVIGIYIFTLVLMDTSIRQKEMIEHMDMKILGIIPEKEGK